MTGFISTGDGTNVAISRTCGEDRECSMTSERRGIKMTIERGNRIFWFIIGSSMAAFSLWTSFRCVDNVDQLSWLACTVVWAAIAGVESKRLGWWGV